MNLSGVIDRMATADSPYTVTRRAAPTYVDGIAVPGAPSPFEAVAVVTPLSGRTLRALPEGRRAEETRNIFTKVELKVGDVVTYKGEAWEVFVSEAWEYWGDGHWHALMARQVIA